MSRLNTTVLNVTLVNPNCISEIFSKDFYSITINCIRITVMLLNLTWAITLFIDKNLRRKEMIFLNNLNAIGSLCCINAFYNLIRLSCSVLTDFECNFQSFLVGYLSLTPSYALMSLVFYRLYCITTTFLRNQLKTYKILICLASIWLLPAIISFAPLLFGFQFNSTYNPTFRFCVPKFNEISRSHFSYYKGIIIIKE